jgi:hypothetical protein
MRASKQPALLHSLHRNYFRFGATCVSAEAAADLAAADERGLLKTLPALLAAFDPVVSLRPEPPFPDVFMINLPFYIVDENAT